MSNEEIDSDYPKRSRRTSNRLGLQEVDEDGWVFLSYGAYTCQGSAPSENNEESNAEDM